MIHGLVVVCATSFELCALLGTPQPYPDRASCQLELPKSETAAVSVFSKYVDDVEYEIVQSWCGDPDAPAPLTL